MSIYKRGTKGVFYMDFVIKGKRVFKSTETFSKREAKIVEAAEKQKMLKESKLTPQEKSASLPLSEAIEQVYEDRWKNTKNAGKTYKQAIRLIQFLGDIPISKIDEILIRKLNRRLDALKLKVATSNRYMAALKTILKHHKQPWEHVSLKKERKGRIRVLTKEEESRAVGLLRDSVELGKCSYYMAVAELAEVLADTGLRLSELLELKYEDVNYTANLISIWVNKGEKPRSLPMTRRVRNILENRQASNPIKPFSITKFQAAKAWAWVRKEMGLQKDKEFVLHALRHTCASRLVNRGVDLYVVKEWLGHSSIQITERYAHLNPSKLVEAAAKLE